MTTAVLTPPVNLGVLQQTFLSARKELCENLIERDEQVEILFNALLAGEHVLFVGDPGTGKSYMVDQFTHLFDGAEMFHVLLTKFSKPEELFGPIDVTGLKEGRYERLTSGYLPTAHVAVVDEIWKASSAIINNLLNMMQERTFKNGVQRIACPLKLMAACSNEWPLGDGKQELGAAFDRFGLRNRVRPISPGARHRLCFEHVQKMPLSRITLSELEAAIAYVQTIPFQSSAEDALDEILNLLHKEGINPGDRRIRKSVGIAKAAAFMDQSSTVAPAHLEILQHVLWEDPLEQAPKTKEVVCKIANPAGAEVTGLMAEAQELIGTFAQIQNGVGNNEVFVSARKLAETIKKLEGFTTNRRAVEAADYCKKELSRAQKKMMGVRE